MVPCGSGTLSFLLTCGEHVVVESIADVQDSSGSVAGCFRDLLEEPSGWLFESKVWPR